MFTANTEQTPWTLQDKERGYPISVATGKLKVDINECTHTLPGTLLTTYRDAIDIVRQLNKDDDEWVYCICTTHNGPGALCYIAIFDGQGYYTGNL